MLEGAELLHGQLELGSAGNSRGQCGRRLRVGPCLWVRKLGDTHASVIGQELRAASRGDTSHFCAEALCVSMADTKSSGRDLGVAVNSLWHRGEHRERTGTGQQLRVLQTSGAFQSTAWTLSQSEWVSSP